MILTMIIVFQCSVLAWFLWVIGSLRQQREALLCEYQREIINREITIGKLEGQIKDLEDMVCQLRHMSTQSLACLEEPIKFLDKQILQGDMRVEASNINHGEIIMEHPPEPTDDQCEEGARLTDFKGRLTFATWYPQMGGYVAKCVIVHESGDCFDAYVWHDGKFPFEYGSPVCLHHCAAEQFIEFGENVLRRIISN